jgi:hypothetical protein
MTTLPDLEPAGMEAARRKGRELAGNQPDALVEAFAEIAAAGAVAYLSSARSAPEAGKAVVKPLEWEEIHQKRSDEDPSTEVVGWEADAGFAAYYTVELTGGGASMTDPDYDEKHFDDPEAAIAAAQADYEQRVLSALASVAPSGAESAIPCHHCGASVISTLPPQAVPAEDIAKIEDALLKLSKVGFGYDLNPRDKWALKQAAAALTSLSARLDATETARYVAATNYLDLVKYKECPEAEAASLRRKLEEAPNEADIYDQAATLAVPARDGGTYFDGIEAYRLQLTLKAALLRVNGVSLSGASE